MGKNLSFIERFIKIVDEKKLFRKNDRLLVGFSGGADSTALLQALWSIRLRYRFFLLAAHVNYNLRGEDSQKDEQFVKQFCFNRNISLVIKNVDLVSESDLENKARQIRFDYFSEIEELYGIKKIVLGHNMKDQAETLLFRLFRGSGYTGIQGIAPIVGKVVHPLLSFCRNDIEDYLKNNEIKWREDRSNQENIQTRNKIRNELLPWIENNVNSDVISKLFNASKIFNQTDDILKNLAKRRLLKAQKKKADTSYTLDIKILKKVKPVLRFYIYKELYARLNSDAKDFYHANFEEIEDILDSDGSKKLDLPNKIFVFKEYSDIIFTTEDLSNNADVENSRKISHLRNRLTFEDFRISMKKLKLLPSKRKIEKNKKTAYLDFDKITFPIYIRHRQAGDSFQPLGMQHHKKLKQFFIDEKVPKFERDNILIFCDDEKIFWVAGHRMDQRVAISEETKSILQLRIEKKSKKKMRAAERIR